MAQQRIKAPPLGKFLKSTYNGGGKTFGFPNRPGTETFHRSLGVEIPFKKFSLTPEFVDGCVEVLMPCL